MAKKRKTLRQIAKAFPRRCMEATAAIILAWLIFSFIGQTLCRTAITQIGQLTNTKITSDKINFNIDGSVNIDNLVVRTNGTRDSNNSEILKAETIHAHFGIGSIFLLRPKIRTIYINNFTMTADYNEDNGQWNFGNFRFKTGRETGKIPVIHLSKGKLLYRKVSGQGAEAIFQAAMEAKLEPSTGQDAGNRYLPLHEDDSEKGQEIYHFEAETSEIDGRKGQWQGQWRPGRFEISGGFETKDADIKGWGLSGVDVVLSYQSNNDYNLKLKIEDMFAREELAEKMFSNIEPLLPASSNVAEAVRHFFNYYQPSGRIGVDIEAEGNLNNLQKESFSGVIWCKDVRFCDAKLPYYIENTSGRVDVTEKNAVLNGLIGRHGNVDLVVDGWVELVGKELRYDVVISSGNMLLDKELYTSLGEQEKKLWDDFSPTGIISVDFRQRRLSGMGRIETMEIGLLNNQAKWKLLGFPLQNLSGELFIEGNQVEVKDIVSQREKEKILINGKVINPSEKGEKYDLEIKGENISSESQENLGLIEKVSTILNNPLSELSKKVQVTGDVNFMLKLNNNDTNNIPQYDMNIECTGNKVVFKEIPYPLNDVSGNITIKKGKVGLENITASTSSDNIKIAGEKGIVKIDGLLNFPENKFREAALRIEANDIYLDKQLGSILPKGLRDFYFDVSPTGRMDLDYRNIGIFIEDDNLYIDLDGQVRFKSCHCGITGAVRDIGGLLKTKGLYQSGEGFCDGQMELNNVKMRIFDKLITDLKTEFHYDCNEQAWESDNLTFSSYNGTITGKYNVKQTDSGWSYMFDVGMENIDLQKFLADPYRYQEQQKETKEATKAKKANDYTTGNMNGSLSAGGIFSNKQSFIGRLRLKITNMEVGKVSLLGKLLLLLNLTEPKDFAFDQMIIDSYARGEELMINEVDISGNAAAFRGSGRMNLKDKNLELSLTARGKRPSTEEPGMLQSLTEGLGQGLVQIEVRGPLEDPKITIMTLPVIQETLGLFGTKENQIKK